MALRISRAKRPLCGRRLDQPGDVAVVLGVLYLVCTVGHPGRVDLAGEAIWVARQLTPRHGGARGAWGAHGVLLNHSRLPARLDSEGGIVTLDIQDPSLRDAPVIGRGRALLQSALGPHRRLVAPPGARRSSAPAARAPAPPRTCAPAAERRQTLHPRLLRPEAAVGKTSTIRGESQW